MRRMELTEVEMQLQADLLTGRVSPRKILLLKRNREAEVRVEPEDRIAKLEAEFAELKARIEVLEKLVVRE